MPEAPMAQAAGGGGGVADVIVSLDAGLAKLAKATLENPQIPEEAKAALQGSLDAFRAFTTALTGEGGGEEPSAQPVGAVSVEGGPNGVPVGHGRPA